MTAQTAQQSAERRAETAREVWYDRKAGLIHIRAAGRHRIDPANIRDRADLLECLRYLQGRQVAPAAMVEVINIVYEIWSARYA